MWLETLQIMGFVLYLLLDMLFIKHLANVVFAI